MTRGRDGVGSVQVVKPDASEAPDALEKGEAKGPPSGGRPLQRDDTAHGSLARRVEGGAGRTEE